MAEKNALLNYFMTHSRDADLDIVKGLIEEGADINFQDTENGLSPLMAISRGSNHYGTVQKNCIDITFFLLYNGADVNAKDIYGWTPLHYSVGKTEGNDAGIVQKMISMGADVNPIHDTTLSPLQQSPLQHACSSFRYTGNSSIIKALLNDGADIHVKNKNGESLLHVIVQKTACRGEPDNIVDVIQDLIYDGINVGVEDNKGKTPLHHASRYGNLLAIDCLIKQGADINELDNRGWSPLFCAAINDQEPAIVELVNKGAELHLDKIMNADELKYIKPIMLEFIDETVSQHNFQKYISDRIENGNDSVTKKIEQFFSEKNSALPTSIELTFTEFAIFAIRENMQDVLEHMIKNNIINIDIQNQGPSSKEQTFLMLAIECKNKNITKLLLDELCDINLKDKDGKTALMYALENNMPDVAAYLIKLGANIKEFDAQNNSVFSYAMKDDANNKIVKYLIKHLNKEDIFHSQDIKKMNINEKIASMLYSENAIENITSFLQESKYEVDVPNILSKVNINAIDAKVLSTLISLGASINIITDKTQQYSAMPPLYSAMLAKNFEAVSILVDAGADVNMIYPDKEKKETLLMYAIKNHHSVDIIEKLLSSKTLDINLINNKGKTILGIAREYRADSLTINKIKAIITEERKNIPQGKDNEFGFDITF